MTNEEIKLQFIEHHVSTIRKMIKHRQVNAFMNVLATSEEYDKPIVLHADIPCGSSFEKEMFAKHGLDIIKEQIAEKQLNVLLVVFTAESWLRKAESVDDDVDNLDVSDEVIIITFSDENGDEVKVFNIDRKDNIEIDDNGNLVEKYDEFDEDGDPIKNVELVYNEDLSIPKGSKIKNEGRFSNLFNKLKLNV
jgi:hypothetical protein